MQNLVIPSKEEYLDWRQSKSGELFNAYLSSYIEGAIVKFCEGHDISFDSFEKNALEMVRDRTRLNVMYELLNLDYDTIIRDLELDDEENSDPYGEISSSP